MDAFQSNEAGQLPGDPLGGSGDLSDLSPAESADLLTSTFDEVLEAATADPAEPLRDAEEIEKFRAENVAVVNPAGPEDHAMVVSTDPLRTPDGALPDLDLSRQGEEAAPSDPLANVTIPIELAQGAELGQANVEVDFQGAGPNDPSAKLISTSGTGSDKEAAFYPDVLPDTDMAIAPVARGFETFTQLRSPESPETVTMQLGLPSGAQLVEDGTGGAVVVDSNDKPLIAVSAPLATDARGSEIPVTMGIEGEKLVLSVPHRGTDVAYPLLVDPLWEYWTWGGLYSYTPGNTHFNGWYRDAMGYSNYGAYQSCNGWAAYDCEGASGSGLIVYAVTGYWYPGNSGAQWWYTPPGTTSYINQAWVYHFRNYQGWGQPGNPYGYFGLSSNCCWGSLYTFPGAISGQLHLAGSISTRHFIMGMASGYNITNQQPRYIRIGSLGLEISDGEDPTLNPLTPSQIPTGWVPGEVRIPFTLSASDNGLGIKSIKLTGRSRENPSNQYVAQWYSPNYNTSQLGTICSGLPGSPCPPNTNYLAAQARPSISFDPSRIPQGADPATNTVIANAVDPVDRQSAGRSFLLKVDHDYPVVTDMSGSLLNEDFETSVGDSDNTLVVTARDGDASSPSTAQSGVKRIEIRIDGQPVPAAPDPVEQSCTVALGSCPMTRTYTVPPNTLAPGDHEIKVTVEDQVNHRASTATWTKTFVEEEETCPTDDPDQLPPAAVMSASDAIDALEQESPQLIAPSQGTVTDEGEALDPALEPGLPDNPAEGSAYRDQILSDNPSMWWRLGDSASATAVDSSHNNRNGTYAGNPLPTRVDDGALVSTQDDDGAVDLNGSNQWISSTYAPFVNGTVRTFEGWAKQDNASGHRMLIAGKGPGFFAPQMAVLGSSVYWAANENESATWSAAWPGVNQWVHWALVFNEPANRAELFINGQSKGVKTVLSAYPQSPGTLHVGVLPWPAFGTHVAHFDGMLDEIAVYERGLSEAEIQEHYVLGNAPASAPLTMTGTRTTGAIEGGSAGGVEVGDVCFRPAATTVAESDPVRVNGDAALYANSAPATDTVVRPSASGAEVILNIRGEEAPDSYSWNFGLPDGQELRELPNGSVAVVDTRMPAPSDPPNPGPAPSPQTLDKIGDARFQLVQEEYYLAVAQQLSPYQVEMVIPPPAICDPFENPETSCPAGELNLELDDSDAFNKVQLTWPQWTKPSKKKKAVVRVAKLSSGGERESSVSAERSTDTFPYKHCLTGRVWMSTGRYPHPADGGPFPHGFGFARAYSTKQSYDPGPGGGASCYYPDPVSAQSLAVNLGVLRRPHGHGSYAWCFAQPTIKNGSEKHYIEIAAPSGDRPLCNAGDYKARTGVDRKVEGTWMGKKSTVTSPLYID